MSRVRVRGWWLAVLVCLGLMAVPWPSWLVEAVYSRRMYPGIQFALTSASNQLGFAVVDVLLVLVAGYLFWRLTRFISRIRDGGVLVALWELMRRLARTAAIVTLIFLCVWGLNYRRTPLEQMLRDGATVAVSTADIRALVERAISGTHSTRPVTEVMELRSYSSVADRLAVPFAQALRHLGAPVPGVLGRPKTSQVLTPFYTMAGITGMVNPFALEAIVHPGLLPFERPMVLAHEWAHLAGFADEADASAVAWLACSLGEPDLAYSAHFFVVLEAAGALPVSVWRDLRPKLDAGVVADMAALRQRLTRQEPMVRDSAFKVYDGYLRSNHVPDGVRSYSRVLRVLVALAAKDGGQVPVSGPSSPAKLPIASAR